MPSKKSKKVSPAKTKKSVQKKAIKNHVVPPTSSWFAKTKQWIKNRRIWQKILLVIGVVLILFVAFMYSLSTWYRIKHQNEPLQLGVSFSATYAESMGLDPKETLEAILKDLKPDRVRLVSYWKEHEKTPGVYDFSELDWQFDLLQKYNAKASLSLGLRQPRWPECHFPDWAMGKTEAEITQPLQNYIQKTVERYRTNPALGEYQLENEYFLKVFGICQEYRSRDRLIAEYNLVKTLDPDHRVIITRSNNALGWPVNEPIPDASGFSVYKRVWDKNITKTYFDYPFPGWFYGSLAAIMEIVHGKPTILHELQAEPWPPSGAIIDNSLEEQDKSMDAKRLMHRAKYGISSGVRTIDFWGAEWWYWRTKKANDPTVWDAGKTIFNEARNK
jgi:hypothetical protein